jgi:hypothetical protein
MGGGLSNTEFAIYEFRILNAPVAQVDRATAF